MKILNDSPILPQEYTQSVQKAKKSFAEVLKDKQMNDIEVKETLNKVQNDMVELKSLLSQIALIRSKKDVS